MSGSIGRVSSSPTQQFEMSTVRQTDRYCYGYFNVDGELNTLFQNYEQGDADAINQIREFLKFQESDSQFLKLVHRDNICRTFANFLEKKLSFFEEEGTLRTHYALFQFYLELRLQSSGYDQLNDMIHFINKIIDNKIFQDEEEFLVIYKKLLRISCFALDFSGYYRRDPFIDLMLDNNFVSFQAKAELTVFDCLYYVASRSSSCCRKIRLHPQNQYEEIYKHLVSSLFLDALDAPKRFLWDLTNYESFFLYSLSYSSAKKEELAELWEIFKNAGYELRAAILNEMSERHCMIQILQRLRVYQLQIQIFSVAEDSSLPFSQLYFAESRSSDWVGYLKGQAYFIIEREKSWKYLCNTEQGEMSDPGPVMDIELLVSEPEIFYFKVLKKDGWHLFDTQSGFNNESWESIWFLKANYFAFKKDKKISISNIDKPFENMREIALVSGDYNIISIQNLNRIWQLYDLKNKKFVYFPHDIKHIHIIEKTKRFIEIEILDGSKYLYDFTTNRCLQMEKGTCAQFSSFDTVYVKKANEEYWSIRDSEWIGPLEPNLYEEVKHYELVPLSPYAGIQGCGLGFHGSSCVRYTFEVELQGRYYITKKPDQQILWFQTTVGGGRSTTLIHTEQGHIAFLGSSRHHYKEEKAFFSLKESGKLTLYISTYNRLKTVIDKRQESPNLDTRTLDAIEVCYLHGSYLKIQKKESGWHLYEEENGFLSGGFEAIDYLDGKHFIKVKQGGFWHLYQLEKRTLLSDCFSEIYYNDKDSSILMLSKKTVRYIALQEIPHIGDCPTFTQDFQPTFASPFLRQN